MKVKIIIIVLIAIYAQVVYGGCPFNDIVNGQNVEIGHLFEKRDGSGEAITATNKTLEISYYNGTEYRWWNGTNWNLNTPQSLTMTQKVASTGEFYYIVSLSALSTVTNKYIHLRFKDNSSDSAVSSLCIVYVQPAIRLSPGTGTGQISLSNGRVGLNLDDTAGTLTMGEIPNLDVAVSTRSSHSAADVWTNATRTLTGGVDITSISGDSVAADNLEAMLDGTGGSKLTLSQLKITATGNDSAIEVTGSGTGSGIYSVGGDTGHGIRAVGGAIIGDGIRATGVGADPSYGLLVSGYRAGLYALGSIYGINARADNGGEAGIYAGPMSGATIGNIDGLKTVSLNSGVPIRGSLSGSVDSVTQSVAVGSIAINAITSAAIANDFEVKIDNLEWATYNIVDLTNEGGDQNPTTTSADTDLTWTIDFTNTTPRPIMYFPTMAEENTQDTNCNVQGLRAGITAYNTTTKVITYNTLPLAPDYRCKFRIY